VARKLTLEAHTELRQHPLRGGVRGVVDGAEELEPEPLERLGANCGCGFGGVPVALAGGARKHEADLDRAWPDPFDLAAEVPRLGKPTPVPLSFKTIQRRPKPCLARRKSEAAKFSSARVRANAPSGAQ